ncbi:hypothetical protein Q5P01_006090 [Channa striata]|uniref:Right handed beta helix domain-containing protein n=1 Tax=Channa striata TaxID=64152 RepID=A0AA88T0G7_CHASR|nr:hypothetical protein Q5P01_006090 [Channa striata]
MEQDSGKSSSVESTESADDMLGVLVVDTDSFVNIELNVENSINRAPDITPVVFQNGEDEEEMDDDDDDDDDDDSENDHFDTERAGTQLQRFERHAGGATSCLPDTFQTNHLLFYERFKAYQDYMLGDCKPSEVKPFIAEYLEKVVEPCDWLALWSTDVFDVLMEVQDLDLKDLKACRPLSTKFHCRSCRLVYEESGDFDQTALALEHLRFFYKNIWREWDEEDDEFDYFVRCVEPRLRLYYDILEDRVPACLVAEYQSLLGNCSQCFQEFSVLRDGLSTDSDSELDNVSMVEGLKLHDQLETFKRKLHIIENPLLRYVLGFKGNGGQQSVQSRGPRESGMKVVHVVTASCSTIQLQSLLNTKLQALCSSGDTEIQFHKEPVSAVESCHEGDVVIILPGVYNVSSSIVIPDSITIEGFGFPDDVVIENKNKGDSFVETTGADVRLSNIKFIQHDAIEGILCVRQGTLNLENCVLQCATTGIIARASAHLNMNMCDLYGSKGAGVEIYPGSVCSLVSNGIHHCKDGILIKDLVDEMRVMPSITMENNVIHNNEGYGVILVKPNTKVPLDCEAHPATDPAGQRAEDKQQGGLSNSLFVSTSTTTPTFSSSAPIQPESTEDNHSADGDVASTSGRKWQFSRQQSRHKEPSCTTQTIQDLMDHPIFVSVQGNQFRRNGRGDIGTFVY